MSVLKSVLLADRGVLRLRGRDACKLLQGLITNDMGLLDGQDAIHAGLLSPQGKILFDFFVLRNGDDYLLEAARDMTAAIVVRLNMYKLRADVTIEDVSRDYSIAAVWGCEFPELPGGDALVYFTDPRLEAMGVRLLATLASDWLISEIDAKPASHDDYDAHRLELGVPEGGKDYVFGDTFVHEALFDQLGGVSFSKGCFIGQEVVSRMQHRGTARRRIVRVEGDGALPEPGSEVRAGASLIGHLGTVVGRNALAKLRLDRVQEAIASGQDLVAGGVPVTVKLADWATFSLGDVSGKDSTEEPRS